MEHKHGHVVYVGAVVRSVTRVL